jgi:hypothetical protein
MDRVESMGFSQKIGRRFRGTPDTGHFDHLMGLYTKLITGLDDGIAGGIMAAPGTKGGISPFIIAPGIPEIILGKVGMTETGATGLHLTPP